MVKSTLVACHSSFNPSNSASFKVHPVSGVAFVSIRFHLSVALCYCSNLTNACFKNYFAIYALLTDSELHTSITILELKQNISILKS